MSKAPIQLKAADLAQIDALGDAFDDAWKAGKRPRIEDYLSQVADRIRTALLNELLCAELGWRRFHGEKPQLAEYQERFAPWRSEIHSLLVADELATDSDPDREVLTQYFREHGYQLHEELGRGAFGRVFRAVELSSHTTVAIKVLWSLEVDSRDSLELFLREMRVHAALAHPSIVRFLASGAVDDRLAWFAMEFVPGGDLDALLARNPGGLMWRDACSIVRQLLEGIDHAHRFAPPQGPFVHRDIKPRNILVTGAPGAFRSKLADFGLAKNFESAGLSDLTRTGKVCGTPVYMSPEQAIDSKYAGPEVDLFAAGAVLYFALCGKLMYDIPEHTPLSAVLNQVVEQKTVALSSRRSDLPQALEAIIRRATGADVVRRFRTARQMLMALEQLAGSDGS